MLSERSATAPLHLVIPEGAAVTETTALFAGLNAERWKSFAIYESTGDQLNQWLRWLTQPLPNMRTLTIEHTDVDAVDFPELDGNTRLTHLNLQSVKPPLDARTLGSITHLRLSGLQDPEATVKTPAQLLHCTPQLQLLSLDDLVFDEALEYHRPAVALPACKTLQLSSVSSNTLQELLPLIELPQMDHLDPEWDLALAFPLELGDEQEDAVPAVDRAIKAVFQVDHSHGLSWALTNHCNTVQLALDFQQRPGSMQITAVGFKAWVSHGLEWMLEDDLAYLSHVFDAKELSLELTSYPPPHTPGTMDHQTASSSNNAHSTHQL